MHPQYTCRIKGSFWRSSGPGRSCLLRLLRLLIYSISSGRSLSLSTRLLTKDTTATEPPSWPDSLSSGLLRARGQHSRLSCHEKLPPCSSSWSSRKTTFDLPPHHPRSCRSENTSLSCSYGDYSACKPSWDPPPLLQSSLAL
jgi:hypothetical protein